MFPTQAILLPRNLACSRTASILVKGLVDLKENETGEVLLSPDLP